MEEKINTFWIILFYLIGINMGIAQSFTDITKTAGIEHEFEVFEGMFGGGAAVLDYNNDGFEDIYLTGGMMPDQLLLNKGDGTFVDQLLTANMEETLDFVTQGVAAADFNRDGWMDLFISTITVKNEYKKIPRAQNLIFINQGNNTFSEESIAFGISEIESFSTGVSIGDFNLDGYPDLYVGNYFTDYDGGLKEISDATIVNAGKTAKGYLYKNHKGKKFVEVSKKYGLDHRGFSFGGVFTDYDNDHDMDLIINNDFGYKAKPNYFFDNQYPKKKFINIASEKGMDLRINAMGAATADVNADGHLDYFISNIRYNRFMFYDSKTNRYEDQSELRGTQLFTISWGANLNDFDHDGDLDLFVSNGDLNPNCVPMYNFLYENNGKNVFTENSTLWGLKDYGIGRGSIVFDIENDGDLDLLIVAQKPVMDYGPPSITRLYRNETTQGNYLKIKLVGNASTKSGFGARIEVYADSLYINHEIEGGNTSHLSHNSRIAHFGIGRLSELDSVIVTWPGGHTQKLFEVDSNQILILAQNKEFKTKHIEVHIWILFSMFIICLFLFYSLIKNK